MIADFELVRGDINQVRIVSDDSLQQFFKDSLEGSVHSRKNSDLDK